MPVTDEPHSAREEERAGGEGWKEKRQREKTGRQDGSGVEEVQRMCQSSGFVY